MSPSPTVQDYLADLRRAATERLGDQRAAELVAEIGEHIEAAVADGRDPVEVIERLGSPREIVGAEPEVQVPAPRLRVREGFAIVLLLVGFLLALVGWVVGLALLWSSDRWSVRDKIVGTLLWPGGLGPFAVLLGSGLGGEVSSTACDTNGCTTEIVSAGWPLGAALAVTAVLVIVPVLTTVHLARSARVPQAA